MIGLQNITDHGIGGCIVQIKLVLIIMEKVCFKIHQNGHTMDRPKCKECNGTGEVMTHKTTTDLIAERIHGLGHPFAYSKRMAEEVVQQIDAWYGSKSMSEIKATVTRPPCKECNGTGEVVYTKEKGGPICKNCGGNGYLTDEIIQRRMASIMDYPSLYMGGPSRGNMQRSQKIIDFLKKEGLL